MVFSKVSFVLMAIAAAAIFFIFSCRNTAKNTNTADTSYEKPRVPDWHKNAVIYEVNLRHFTKENTFSSFEAHIP
ncbi:MAG: hypothetical protein WAT37_08360, partial [Saprospiraceae bacterium]